LTAGFSCCAEGDLGLLLVQSLDHLLLGHRALFDQDLAEPGGRRRLRQIAGIRRRSGMGVGLGFGLRRRRVQDRVGIEAQHQVQLVRHRIGFHMLIGPGLPDVRHEQLHDVDRLEDDVDHARRDRHVPLTELVQDAFRPVGHIHQPREAQKAGGPLHAVHGPEDLVQELLVAGVGFQGDEPLIQQFEHLLGFRKKVVADLYHFVFHGPPRSQPSAISFQLG
jgi:hypothetical protein